MNTSTQQERSAADDQLIEQELVRAARTDPVGFNDYVLRDERDNTPVTSCAMHEEWQKLVSKHPRLVVFSHIESGKSMQIAVGRVLFELGKNPDLRVLIVANTAGQAAKILGIVGHHIEHSTELHKVFPALQKDATGPWNQTALTVRRSGPSRDPSVQACGIHGNVLGSRVDLLLADDICDFENSRSTSLRDDLDRWFRSTVLGRLTEHSRAWILGNPWHRDDQLARLEGSGWKTLRYPVTGGLFGRSRWPERWPASRIESVRRDLGPREAARQLDCLPPDDADPVFAGEWIANALRLGENAATEYYASASQPGDVIVLGVDTAYSEKKSADESALVLCRSFRATGRREVTQITAGRWAFDALSEKIVTQCQISRAVAVIETNAGGEYIAQAVEKAVPVVRLNTSAASKKMRVEMLSSEFASGRWSFRQPGFLDEQMKKLAQGLLSFSFEDHADDRVSALLVAVEAIRMREQRPMGRVFSLDTLSR